MYLVSRSVKSKRQGQVPLDLTSHVQLCNKPFDKSTYQWEEHILCAACFVLRDLQQCLSEDQPYIGP
jgi:hypothetical protein